jgi:hypothetical protein
MNFLRLFGRAGRPGDEGPLRLLVVSSPRSGNTWLRTLLTKVYGFDVRPHGEIAVHRPADVPWDDLPPRCILQLHWHNVEPLTSLLRAHRFRTLTLVRHPFEALISVLQYCQHIDETYKWLDGEGGDESGLPGASPCSEAFLRYAESPRAAALLSVSPEWWGVRGALRVRYEDLVRDTPGALARLGRSLGRAPAGRVAKSVDACAIDRLRRPDNAPHFWQGTPDLWRSLLTAGAARRIWSAHGRLYRRFGYRCDADPSLTPERAEANWRYLRDNPRAGKAKSA